MLKISIITPSYNQGRFIKQTIQSVLQQNDPFLEYLVIDGGSTDSTLNILKQFNNILKYISKPDKGQAEAVNKGLKMAKGEIIGWLNSDDLYCHNTLKLVRQVFETNPRIDIVYGDYFIIDEKGKKLWHQKEITAVEEKMLLYGPNFISQPTVFIKKEVITKVGLLNEKLNFALDLEWWLRIIHAGYKFTHIPYPLAKMRLHDTSKTIALEHHYQQEINQVKKRYFTTNTFNQIFISLLMRIRRQLLRLRQRGEINIIPQKFLVKNKYLRFKRANKKA